jgi:predicted transcriptional regulator
MDSKYRDDYKYMADKLKVARIEAGLGQGNAARLIDKSQSYISKIEAGCLRLDLVQLNELAKLYEKDIKFFIREN